jgi:prolyl-tRNA synthetase
MNGVYINDQDKNDFYQMGCYGIGVSRTLAMVYENSLTKDKDGNITGFALPLSIAPYKIYIIAKDDDEKRYSEAEEFYKKLVSEGIPAIFDDTKSSIGFKIKNNDIIGTPYMAIFGSKNESGMVELENNFTKEKQIISTEDLIKYLKNK